MGKKEGGNLHTAAYADARVGKEQNPEVSNYKKGTWKLVRFSFYSVQCKQKDWFIFSKVTYKM